MALDANGFPVVSWNGYSTAPGHVNPNGVVSPGGSGASSAHEVADANAYGYVDGKIPSWVASDAADAKFSGKMTRGQFDAWRLEQQSGREAREYETWLANTAWQRKVADLEAAGFSPLAALDATGQGAAVPTAQVARASSHGVNSPNILGALITAIALIASKGIAAATSAKSAATVASIKASNRLALAALYRRR